MPVQQIELEEVTMIEASDEALEAMKALVWGVGTTPWCTTN
jgi:hypothetical protein